MILNKSIQLNLKIEMSEYKIPENNQADIDTEAR
jgi:hypothetical protein